MLYTANFSSMYVPVDEAITSLSTQSSRSSISKIGLVSSWYLYFVCLFLVSNNSLSLFKSAFIIFH